MRPAVGKIRPQNTEIESLHVHFLWIDAASLI